MEDLDGMIMDTLKKLDCTFCNEVDSLSLMGLNDIVEATVKLLWACNAENRMRIPSFQLPHIMTVKYKTATTIANAIKELGIREEVGYQTLLYPNVFEIRQIFISLIEKLPKQAIQADDSKSPLDQLKSQISVQIQEDLKKTKYPCYCRFLMRASSSSQGSKWHLKAHHPEFFNFSTCTHHPTNDFRHKICTALEGTDHNGDFSIDELAFKQLDSTTSKLPKRIVKPLILNAKPTIPPKPKPRTSKTEEVTSPSKEDETKKLAHLQEQNNTLRLELETRTEHLHDSNSLLRSIDSQIHFNTMEMESKDEKLLQILRDPETQFASLQKFVDQASARRQELEKTLEEWKAENLPELERLRQQVSGHSLSNVQLQEAQRKAEQLRKAINEQSHALHKLQKQANKDSDSELDGSERTKFLSRIMYLVKSVNAQKEEIMRSFQACQLLEKERRQLDGNLDRTFTVVTQWLNGAAKSDAILRKAHNLLVRMHGQCDMIIQSIQAIFTINHASDEFQDQIELLAQQQVDSALDQILTDLLRVRQENEELRARLSKMR